MSNTNGDTNRVWQVDGDAVVGVGSFHKTLPHNKFGEVDRDAFAELVSATRGNGGGFAQIPLGAPRLPTKPATQLTNPQAGLSTDRLTHSPALYVMPPAPRVNSNTIAAEMTELYWMAALRDVDWCGVTDATTIESNSTLTVGEAVKEINKSIKTALGSGNSAPIPKGEDGSTDHFLLGIDLPGSSSSFTDFSAQTLFRLGFPGDDVGPMVSQFFLRPASFGTQTIDQRQRPYKKGVNYLTEFPDWLAAQDSGMDAAGQSYSKANEDGITRFDSPERFIATLRDLARFVNKDALHQAYFNAALILLSGGAKWSPGNPYHDLGNGVVQGALSSREAGFGVLGGPHLLALVSEVATRALKVVWQQKWQQHLRLRPESYGGLAHVQFNGVKVGSGPVKKRAYGLPDWVSTTKIAKYWNAKNKTLLLPMAYTPGSPTHPAYGAGHATVAGSCVTILKAYFETFTTDTMGIDHIIPFSQLVERHEPFDPPNPIAAHCTDLSTSPIETCSSAEKVDNRIPYKDSAKKLTIEGELNKLAQNVAMGRSMGGVHWRTDNTRSLMLGEALAAEILAGITNDANERPFFAFRTFQRRADGQPKKVLIEGGRIFVDGVERVIPTSFL
ncbi:vanadium-dependent haloperoxidase [Methylocystis sp. H62]|uniref:vanadium-dependent haloperoxidase n=1 Tax=Methylocystis sp. H62 TaxID=2785789 RepID=UPI0018C2EB2D|nr:vanadium-dependent haloperoxidase [Methylocystis sp. H62]MBG0792329.1 vanadium-dependent haloperoxidase [Methylocystis sp. H62]